MIKMMVHTPTKELETCLARSRLSVQKSTGKLDKVKITHAHDCVITKYFFDGIQAMFVGRPLLGLIARHMEGLLVKNVRR